jgi:hypothetical protein
VRFDVFRRLDTPCESDNSTPLTTSQRRVEASRLERPGIGPGAARGIIPAVDTIDVPQPLSIPRQGVDDKRWGKSFKKMARLLLQYSIIGSVSVVILEAIYASASLYSHIPYAWFTIPQLIFYGVFSWFVVLQSSSWRVGAGVALLTSIADATLGWWASCLIGPGCPSTWDTATLVAAALWAIVICSLVGAASAALTLRWRHTRSAG